MSICDAIIIAVILPPPPPPPTYLAIHELESAPDILALDVGAVDQEVDDGLFISTWEREEGREGGREGRWDNTRFKFSHFMPHIFLPPPPPPLTHTHPVPSWLS